MVAGCGNNMLKYIMLFLNLLIFLMSLVGLIASLVFILKPDVLDAVSSKAEDIEKFKESLSGETIKVGLYVILATSIIILIISFLGCCGAWKEIKFLLGLYAAVMIIILIAEIAAFVVAIVFKSKVKGVVKKTLQDLHANHTDVFTYVEKELDCCGVNDNDHCVNSTTSLISTTSPTTGCYNKIVSLLHKFYTLVLVISIITVVIEFLLIIFSCCLCSNIGENVA